uniref:Hist_deacetyl domain-containing protein n=1 Tax=Globodera pallida TaxID=36090 RepID=A0A183C9R3_GLOPA
MDDRISWNSFADWSRDLNINVADIDVTTNPGLSGRFLVTALPTIYQLYTGPRDKNDFISFIEDKRWTSIDPLPSYKHPDSAQMGVVAVFFKLSMAVRDLHGHMVEKVGVPSWASYAFFATVTLALGCVLGFIIVCIIDYVFPTGANAKKLKEAERRKEQSNPKQKAKDAAEKGIIGREKVSKCEEKRFEKDQMNFCFQRIRQRPEGNGHERDFAADRRVYILDLFNAYIYPHDEVAKTSISRAVPLDVGTEDDVYLRRLDRELDAAFRDFPSPDVLIYVAGTDSLVDDPLGLLRLSPQGIVRRDELVFRAAIHREVPVTMVTSGGYTNRGVRGQAIGGKYSLILLNNRDVDFDRATSALCWRDGILACEFSN